MTMDELYGARVYGPVRSRRLGSSLGVDILPPHTCTFDCVYCQLGGTQHLVSSADEAPGRFPTTDEIVAAVQRALDDNPELDYITMSGRGEPMLSPYLGDVVTRIRDLTDVPLALITNATLLVSPAARSTASRFDLVVPSLDAATDEGIARVNRPAAGFRAEDIIAGIAKVARSSVTVWLEIMFVRSDEGPSNVDDASIDALVAAAKRIGPDRVDVNTCVRRPAKGYVHPLSQEELETIAERFRAADLSVLVVPDRPTGHGG
ncbi:MAG: radical SAM protein [Methanopyri archaeon]|nr:radical SAM protein [Methanopyri archaeon]